MLLFRIINLNTTGVFLFLSFSPLFLTYFIWITIIFLGLSYWCSYSNYITALLFILIICITIFLISLDNNTDTIRGLFESTTLNRIIQYCFIWFILSEIGLFSSFFYGVFSTSLLVSFEFTHTLFCTPLLYSLVLTDLGYIFYWVFLDLFNIVMNTFFLFVSGLTINAFLVFSTLRLYFLSEIYITLSILLGALFVWNQLWEFTLLEITFSSNAFGSSLFLIDMLHFLHVSYGIISMLYMCIRLTQTTITDKKMLFFICSVLYWHFVDVIWFFLLRVIYFDILCILFLF